jgi:hypothetical protein
MIAMGLCAIAASTLRCWVADGHAICAAGRTAATFREDLEHLMKTLGNSSALLRVEGRPVYYVYDSYRVSAQDWAALFDPQGASTVRGTALDGECEHLGTCGQNCLLPVCQDEPDCMLTLQHHACSWFWHGAVAAGHVAAIGTWHVPLTACLAEGVKWLDSVVATTEVAAT